MDGSTDTWKTATEAAAILGVSVSTMRQWANEGRLPCYRTEGGHRRFKLTDLEESLRRSRRRAPTRRRLRVLEQTTQTVCSRLDLDRLLGTIPTKTLGVIDCAEAASLFLFKRDIGRLVVHSTAGFDADAMSRESLRLGEGIAGKVLLSRRPLRLSGHKDIVAALGDLSPENRSALRKALGGHRRGKGVMAVPLLHDDDALGVLLVANLTREAAFSEDDQSLLQVIASQVATAIENAKAFEQIKRLHLDSLKILLKALNAKDYYSYGHAMRVSAYAQLLGRELGMTDILLAELEEAASLHDIGKVGLSDELLLKASGDAGEIESMREHPLLGAQILSPLFAPEVLAGVRSHHEHWDGSGYPAGSMGKEIPELARLLAVVNHYDSLTIPRVFRRPLTYDEAREALMLEAGLSLEPRLVDLFLRVLDALRARRDAARAVAAEAAAQLEPEAHSLLHVPTDTARSEYEEGVLRLRRVLEGHAEVAFLTTLAQGPDGFFYVLDAEVDEAIKSHLGDGLLEDGELPEWFAGEAPDRVVISVDEYGVWVSGYAPLRDSQGGIVAIVDADLPAIVVDESRDEPVSALTQMMSKIGTRMVSAELQAISDGLTGLFNHRHFQERLQQTIDAAALRGERVALIFADLDNLKHVNDTLGHAAGDACLVAVARVVQDNVRGDDVAARYGGDEFAVILSRTDADHAVRVAERIRAGVAAVVGRDEGPEGRAVTVSVGVAVFPDDGETREELLGTADAAMYLAKAGGKNRVCTPGRLKESV